MSAPAWPPRFALSRERILKLLTGERFYSDPSAALREAILNAIDAVHRRQQTVDSLDPMIDVTFDPPLFTNGREAGRREAASALDSEC